MKLPRVLSNAPSGVLARLSLRERLLTGLALAICFVVLSIYVVRVPGDAAARSAASRNNQAAADLAEARALAAQDSDSTQQSALPHLDRLIALAAQHGLVVVDFRQAEGTVELQMNSESSTKVIAWAAEASVDTAPLTSLSITREGPSGLAVKAAFKGASR
jgi:hypothetical protein